MKMLKTVLVPAIAVLALSAGAAFAQTATPAPAAPAPANTMAPAAKPAMTADQKTAISKACSAAADKQGLKGKPRKAFRQSCRSHGGPAS